MPGRWQRAFDRALYRTGDKDRAIALADRRSREIYMQTGTRETSAFLSSRFTGVGWRELESVLADHNFWADQKILVLSRMEPLMRTVFDEGIAFAKTIDTSKGLARIVGRCDTLEPDDATLADAADQIFRNYTDDWWNQLQHTTQNALRQAIIAASQDGSGTPGVIARIAPLFGNTRAANIGITETTRLFGRGAQATYVAAGVETWIWHDVEDDRVCDICFELNGKTFPMSHLFDPAHVKCLVEGTEVWGPAALGAYIRRFEGEGVFIRTADGDELTITPNHPILTDRGWLPAGELTESDHVVSYGKNVHTSLTSPDDVLMPTRVEKIAASLLSADGMAFRGVPIAPEDFHRDIGQDGKVDIVRADGLLRDNLGAQLRQFDEQDRLERTFVRLGRLSSLRRPNPTLQGNDASFGSIMGGRDLMRPVVCRHGRPLQQFGGMAVANGNLGFHKSAPHNNTAYAERLRESQFRFAEQITSDDLRIVDKGAARPRLSRLNVVRHVGIVGHVYNLETSHGWYAANGIVVQNCRCFPGPG